MLWAGRPGMSFLGRAGWVFIRKLDGVLTALYHDPTHPGSVPHGQGAQGRQRGLLPAGGSPASCSQEALCQAGTAQGGSSLAQALCSRS
jgi:hypothetical protein